MQGKGLLLYVKFKKVFASSQKSFSTTMLTIVWHSQPFWGGGDVGKEKVWRYGCTKFVLPHTMRWSITIRKLLGMALLNRIQKFLCILSATFSELGLASMALFCLISCTCQPLFHSQVQQAWWKKRHSKQIVVCWKIS